MDVDIPNWITFPLGTLVTIVGLVLMNKSWTHLSLISGAGVSLGGIVLMLI
jgi:hypothetical protein